MMKIRLALSGMSRLLLVMAMASVTTISLDAQSNEVSIFVSTSRLALSTGVTEPGSGIEAVHSLEEKFGFGASYTRFWTPHVATELSLQQADSTVQARIESGLLGATLDVGTLDVTALSALLQWHFQRDAAVSPWIGAGIVGLDAELHVPRQIAELADLEDTDLDRVASWLLNAGVSFRIHEKIRLAADAKYTRYKPNTPTPVFPDGEAIHPLLVTAGVRLRF